MDYYEEGKPLTRRGLYQLVTDEVFKDGEVEPWESAVLNHLAKFLRLDPAEAEVIAKHSAKKYVEGNLGTSRPLDPKSLYKKTVYYVLSDLRVDTLEDQMMDGLRRMFRVTQEAHTRLLTSLWEHWRRHSPPLEGDDEIPFSVAPPPGVPADASAGKVVAPQKPAGPLPAAPLPRVGVVRPVSSPLGLGKAKPKAPQAVGVSSFPAESRPTPGGPQAPGICPSSGPGGSAFVSSVPGEQVKRRVAPPPRMRSLPKQYDVTDLIKAIRDDDEDEIRTLLGRDINVNDQDVCGMTPLHWAAARVNVDFCRKLIEKGADVNARNLEGMTPLHEVIEANARGNKKMVRLLVDSGSDLHHKRDISHETPLHTAARLGRFDIVTLLVQKGADTKARDDGGQTAHDLAMKGGYTKVVVALRKA